MSRLWICLVMTAVVGSALASSLPKSYSCRFTSEPIHVNGSLDDPAWGLAGWSDPFVDIEGVSKPHPRFETRVQMLWDSVNFYIAARMQEPHVWATIVKRDSIIFHDNDFEVFLDPDGDNHQYGELEINSLNTQWDLFLPKPYRDNGHALDCWNIEGLQTAVAIQGTLNDPSDLDTGWTVEIALPWRGLEMCSHSPSPPRIGDFWRVNFSRVEWQHETVGNNYVKVQGTREDNWVWSPQGEVNMHLPERWGFVRFVITEVSQQNLPDIAVWELLQTVHRVYYSQKTFREQHGSWAVTLDQLDVLLPKSQIVVLVPALGGWQVSAKSSAKIDRPVTVYLRDDSRIWTDSLSQHP